MAVTAGGTPYVESSDLVANYPAVSLAVADKIDTKADSASPRFTGDVGIGTVTPANDVHIFANGGTSSATVTSESLLYLQDSGVGAGNGGGVLFGAAQGSFASIKGSLTDGSSNSAGYLSVGVRAFPSDANLTEQLRINTNGYIQGTGLSLGAYTTFTPTLSGTGWTIGNGTSVGKYSQIGKRVNYSLIITFGSTSTFGGAGLEISLPVARTANDSIFNGIGIDVSTANYYTLPTVSAAGSIVKPQAIQSAIGLIQEVISTKPFTWANGDQIYVSGSYEAV
jgi:hypothetical protein